MYYIWIYMIFKKKNILFNIYRLKLLWFVTYVHKYIHTYEIIKKMFFLVRTVMILW